MLALSVAVLLLAPFVSSQDNCECISYFFCNGTIVENDNKCVDDFDVCCVVESGGSGTYIEPTTSSTITSSITTPATESKVPQASGGSLCGKRNVVSYEPGDNIDWKVFDDEGGDISTSFGEFPWMVAILKTTSSGNVEFLCGGSIIYPNIILTAAHSIRNLSERDLLVKAGLWDTKNPDEAAKHQDRYISQIVVHPGFNKQKIANDFALLVLSQPLTITDNVAPVCLPSTSFQLNTSSCVATGWGSDNYGRNTTSSILKKVDLPVVDFDTCQDSLRQVQKLGSKFNLHNSFTCAGGGKADTCLGDGGGPLMCATNDDPSRYVQVGVTSWGVGCGQGPPGVYASVPAAMQWIESTADANP